jgi:hypothetical protein
VPAPFNRSTDSCSFLSANRQPGRRCAVLASGVQMVEAGDWVQVTVQFTKLSMHVDIAPAMAVGRRRRAEQQHAQPSPSEVWEEEIEHEDEDEGKGRGGAEAGLRGRNESDTDTRSKRRRDWVRLDD